MAGPYIENYTPAIKQARGINTLLAATFGSTLTVTGAFASGAQTITGAMSVSGITTPTGGIAAAGGFSQSPRCTSTGNRGVTSLTAPHSTAFVTTDTYIAEIFVEGNMTVTGVAVLMGTTAGNGNISVALANSSGVVVASSATTTTSGTSTTFTQVALSTPYSIIGPATYYVLVQGANTGDFLGTHVAGNFGASLKTSETYGTFTTITPPTTFTANQGPIADLY